MVKDGYLITDISVSGAFEFELALVESLTSKDKKDKLEKRTSWKL